MLRATSSRRVASFTITTMSAAADDAHTYNHPLKLIAGRSACLTWSISPALLQDLVFVATGENAGVIIIPTGTTASQSPATTYTVADTIAAAMKVGDTSKQ